MIDIRQTEESDAVLFELFDSSVGDVRLGDLALHDSGYILSLHVLSAFRGRGYGKALLEACIEYAEGQGMELSLDVSENAKVAIHLYESFGFKRFDAAFGFIQMERKTWDGS